MNDPSSVAAAEFQPSPVLGPELNSLTSPKLQSWHWDRQAIVYVRQSSPQQVQENREVAESSETLDRPGFQRLLQDIREGKVDCVVIHRLDRLSRRILDWTEFLQELKDRQVALTIVTLPELGLRAEDTFFLNIMASVAEFEQEMMRERMADARAAHKRRGRRVAGVVP